MDQAGLNATQLVELVVGTALVLPFAKWAAGELWARVGNKERELEQSDESLRVLLQRMSDKMDGGFTEVRGLIGVHNLSIHELKIEWKHMEDRLRALEAAQSSVPKAIEESRHALRNELTALLLRKQTRDEEDT